MIPIVEGQICNFIIFYFKPLSFLLYKTRRAWECLQINHKLTNMLKPQVNHLYLHQIPTPPILTRWKKNFIAGDVGVDGGRSLSSFVSLNTLAFPTKHRRRCGSFLSQRNTGNSVGQIKADAGESNTASSVIKTISLRAVITVQLTVGGVLSNLSFTRAFDDIGDLLGKSLLLELVSADADSSKCIWSEIYKLFFFKHLLQIFIFTYVWNHNIKKLIFLVLLTHSKD